MNARSIAALVGLLLLAPAAGAQATTRLVVSGVSRPLWAGAPRGDARLFVGLKGGQIRIVKNGQLLPVPFLDISGLVSSFSEQGLLGVAFHPDYANNGFFYVNYTEVTGDTVVSRFQVSANPDVSDPSSEQLVLAQNQPFDNHNGGDLHFGPDGYLYIFFGDGGSANDPQCRGQKFFTLLGKVARIDVDSAVPYAIPPDNPFPGASGVRGEIWHYGLRNPWRNSFDRLTGDLYIGDVGQDLREELDFAPAGIGGLNFGWKVMEGTLCNQTTNCDPGQPLCNDPAYVPPFHELLHSDGAFSIIGGYVYRGCAVPSEYGKYFFADYWDNKIRSLEYDRLTGTVSNLQDRTAELAPGGGLAIRNIAAFGEDGFGELLIVDESGAGEVFKMVPAGAPAGVNAFRNGTGVNRPCLSASSRPILGNQWEVRVDAAGHPGATFSYLVGYTSPQSGVFLAAGEVLVDTTSPMILRSIQVSTGAADVFRFPMPCSPSLIGVTTSWQSVILGAPAELCNALDVTIGYY